MLSKYKNMGEIHEGKDNKCGFIKIINFSML